MAVPRRVKASRWVLVGSVSMGMVTWVPVNRTWLRAQDGQVLQQAAEAAVGCPAVPGLLSPRGSDLRRTGKLPGAVTEP
jgi:hypothetical protein